MPAEALHARQARKLRARARVQGKELEAKKLEHQITLERELIRIQGLGGTQQQRDQMAAHARAQTVLADKQAEIAQAQKLANIQRGNMPGQPMSEGAKSFRMMNVSAQLQDVAVQAQMGTSTSTILAQQGPQLISALGGSGAMAAVAGIAAIGVAAVAFGRTADESFKKAISASGQFREELENISFGSGFSEINTALGGIQEKMAELNNMDAAGGFWSSVGKVSMGILKTIGTLGKGDSRNEETIKIERQQAAIQAQRVRLQGVALELVDRELELSRLKLNGTKEEVENYERGVKLAAEMEQIRKSGFMDSTKKTMESAAIEMATNDLLKSQNDKQKKEDAYFADEEFKAAQEFYDEQEKGEKHLREVAEKMRQEDAEEERAGLEKRIKKKKEGEKEIIDIQKRINDKDAADRTKAAADFSKIEDERRKKLEDRLKIDEKMALSQDRLKKAQEEYKRTANGSLAQEQAAAKVAAAKMEVEDRREAQIQRAMGGSIAEGQARRSERAEERARARAERIVTNREINKKRAEMERDRKPRAEIEAALDAIRGRKKDEVKDQQMAIKAAVESSATSLQILVGKLTVA